MRLIFDYQHFWCLNPERVDLVKTLEAILATWRTGQQLKIHYSSQRMESREQVTIDKLTRKKCDTPPNVAPRFGMMSPLSQDDE